MIQDSFEAGVVFSGGACITPDVGPLRGHAGISVGTRTDYVDIWVVDVTVSAFDLRAIRMVLSPERALALSELLRAAALEMKETRDKGNAADDLHTDH